MFEPVFNKNYNCLDTALANAAKYYTRDHELMFLGAWGFRFSENHTLPIERRLKTDWQRTKEYLSIFHGIQEETIESNGCSLQKELILAELQNNRAVVVKTDTYRCKWNLAFGRHHIPHFYLIIGRDNDNFICIDTYSSEKVEYVELGEIFDAIYTFKCNDITRESVIFRVRQLLGSNIFLQRISGQKYMIENFAKEVVNIGYDNIALLAKEVWASPICRKIKEIGCGRRNFLSAILYLEGLSIDFEMSEIKRSINEIISDWDKVYRLIIKVSFLQERDSIIIRIKGLLDNIAYTETKIAEQIVSIFA
jgi:hypothetical protein